MPEIGPGGSPCQTRAGQHLSMRDRAVVLDMAWAREWAPRLHQREVSHKVLASLVAISQAESSGYAGACHINTDGSIDRGFMQINSSHGFGASSYDPAQCAAQAWEVYYSQGFKAWDTYKGAAYKAALPLATAAIIRAGSPVGTFTGTEHPTNSPACVYALHAPQANFVVFKLGGNSICLDEIYGGLKMAAGAFILLLGVIAMLAVLSRSSPTVRAAVRTGSSLVPEGRIAKKAVAARRARTASRTAEAERSATRGAAERRRAETHAQRTRHTEERHVSAEARRKTAANSARRRANAAAKQRRTQSEESHLAAQSRRDSAAARSASTRSRPAEMGSPRRPRANLAGTGRRPSRAEAGTPF